MKSLLLCIAFLAVTLTSVAQTSSVTLLTFAGYTFADKFETYYGYGKIQNAFQWGAGLEFGIQPGAAMELIYLRSDADAYYDSYYDKRIEGKVGLNYILLGATRYAPINDVVSAFGTFDMGAGFTSNIDESLSSSNVTKFAIGGRLGLRIAPNDKISLRVHAQIFYLFNGLVAEFILAQVAAEQVYLPVLQSGSFNLVVVSTIVSSK